MCEACWHLMDEVISVLTCTQETRLEGEDQVKADIPYTTMTWLLKILCLHAAGMQSDVPSFGSEAGVYF